MRKRLFFVWEGIDMKFEELLKYNQEAEVEIRERLGDVDTKKSWDDVQISALP